MRLDRDNRGDRPVAPPTGRDPLFVVGLALLLVLASWMLFYRLGAPDLRGDEAIWASCLDVMTPANAWIGPGPGPKMVPLDRPPLYLWLTYATQPLLTDPELAIRVWAATAGVATVALTVILGAGMFGRSTGLLAGLVLVAELNWIFHFSHGARSGVSDAVITLLLLATAGAIWRDLGAPRDQKRYWLIAGFGLAGIGMLKPLLLLPTLGFLTLFAFLYGEGPSRLGRLRGTARSVGTCLLLVLPWTLAMVHRFGITFVAERYVLGHISQRVIEGHPKHLEGPLYYLEGIHLPPSVFTLYVPAMLLATVMAFRSPNRRSWGLTVIFGIGWVGFFSLFVSKRIWYIFPAYPFIAIAIAASLAWATQRLAHRLQSRPSPRVARTLGVLSLFVIVPLLLVRAEGLAYLRERWHDVPWRLYRGIQNAPQDGAQLVRYRFPERTSPPTYGFYDRRMTDAISAGRPKDLRKIISRAAASGTELVVVAPQGARGAYGRILDHVVSNGGKVYDRPGFRVMILGNELLPVLYRGDVLPKRPASPK